MGEEMQAQLSELDGEVRAATIPGGWKHSAVWCVTQLPALYVKFRQTYESRYSDEITRLVRAVLVDLADARTTCPEALQLTASIVERLNRLHSNCGLPRLDLRVPVPPSPRSRKAKAAVATPTPPKGPVIG
jgi:hypothetical protein